LLLIPAPKKISPSQRFRIEQYIHLPEGQQLNFTARPFFSPKTWSIFHVKNHLFEKLTGIMAGFIRRWITMLSLPKFDFVYIHKEAAPIGPPIFEWIIAKVFRKKIIYDFDDNIWTSLSSEANPSAALVKCNWKAAYICKYSHIVTVGNEFLAAYARKYNNDVRIIPTVVNTQNHHNKLKNQSDKNLTIGWTGTYTNLHNLSIIENVIRALQEKYSFTFLIIANKDPQLKNLKYTYIKWNIKTEIDDLMGMNIGIMPLAGTDVEMGKCGFKAIQYASLGIPAVVSPVGANKEVVTHQQTGFWANSETEWFSYLEQLILNESLRSEMGIKARNKMIAEYSVDANKEKFFHLFS
jgi:glycosyltransferase involved in cell wall biosynthesis